MWVQGEGGRGFKLTEVHLADIVSKVSRPTPLFFKWNTPNCVNPLEEITAVLQKGLFLLLFCLCFSRICNGSKHFRNPFGTIFTDLRVPLTPRPKKKLKKKKRKTTKRTSIIAPLILLTLPSHPCCWLDTILYSYPFLITVYGARRGRQVTSVFPGDAQFPATTD